MTSLKVTHFAKESTSIGDIDVIAASLPDTPLSRLTTKFRDLELEYVIRCCTCSVKGNKPYYWIDGSFEEPDYGVRVVRIGCTNETDDLLIKETFISCVDSDPEYDSN